MSTVDFLPNICQIFAELLTLRHIPVRTCVPPCAGGSNGYSHDAGHRMVRHQLGVRGSRGHDGGGDRQHDRGGHGHQQVRPTLPLLKVGQGRIPDIPGNPELSRGFAVLPSTAGYIGYQLPSVLNT